MQYEIKEVNYDNEDFKNLCRRLDDFQNDIFPERVSLNMSALDGLQKLEKVLIMYDGKEAIASGALKPVNADTAELARMYTSELYRGQGIAKKMIKEIIAYAKIKGYKKIILDTWKESTSARNLYTSLGFKERPPFDAKTFQNSFSTYDKSIQDKIQEKLVFMELDLQELEFKK